MLHLDGSTLEGGGQLVRNAVSLSALTSQPLHISRIRGSRRGVGGLRASHAAAVKFLLEACGGEADDLDVGSRELTFYPRGKLSDLPDLSTPSSEAVEPSVLQHGLLLRSTIATLPIKPEYNIKLATPGSVFLIFQALYPYILYAGARANGTGLDVDSPASPITLNITGGTNTTSSPTYDYFSQVIVPNFARLGLPRLSVQLGGRGWCTGRVQLGTASFTVGPLMTYRCETSNPERGEGVKIKDTQSAELIDGMVTRVPIFPNIQLHNFERGYITQIDITVLAPDFPFEQMESQAKASRADKAAKKRDKRQNGRKRQSDAASVSDGDEGADEDSNSMTQKPGGHDSGNVSAPHSIRRFLEERTASVLRPVLNRYGHVMSKDNIGAGSGRSSKSDISVNLYHSESTSHPLHIYLLLVAYTSNGFRLGRDALYGINDKGHPAQDGDSSQRDKQKRRQKKSKSANSTKDDAEARVETMIENCVSDLMFELNNGDMRYLDTFMRDQVVVFQTLGQLGAGRNQEQSASQSDDEEDLSLHARTAKWVCEEMLGVKI